MAEEKNMIDEQEIAALAEELGISNLAEEKRNELIAKMTEVLLKRIFVETMEALSEDGQAEYEKMLEADDVSAEQIQQFFESKIENYPQFLQNIIDTFKQEMREVGQQSQEEAEALTAEISKQETV